MSLDINHINIAADNCASIWRLKYPLQNRHNRHISASTDQNHFIRLINFYYFPGHTLWQRLCPAQLVYINSAPRKQKLKQTGQQCLNCNYVFSKKSTDYTDACIITLTIMTYVCQDHIIHQAKGLVIKTFPQETHSFKHHKDCILKTY